MASQMRQMPNTLRLLASQPLAMSLAQSGPGTQGVHKELRTGAPSNIQTAPINHQTCSHLLPLADFKLLKRASLQTHTHAQTLALVLVQQYHILGTLPRVILALGALGGQGRGCPKS